MYTHSKAREKLIVKSIIVLFENATIFFKN
jgi:hypothetical protein